MTKKGSLIIAGTGIRFFSQITTETRQAIEAADFIFYLADDPTAQWINKVKPASESLIDFYQEGGSRLQSYEKMVDRILAEVRRGLNVCALFYGHPGVFVVPGHEAINRAKQEGFEATMLPGISAADSLYADLGFDPRFGCQSFSATDFLIHHRTFDESSALILWQADAIGDLTYRKAATGPNPGIHILVEELLKTFPPAHPVIIYTASQAPASAPRIQQLMLDQLPEALIPSASLLFIPGKEPQVDQEILRRLRSEE